MANITDCRWVVQIFEGGIWITQSVWATRREATRDCAALSRYNSARVARLVA